MICGGLVPLITQQALFLSQTLLYCIALHCIVEYSIVLYRPSIRSLSSSIPNALRILTQGPQPSTTIKHHHPHPPSSSSSLPPLHSTPIWLDPPSTCQIYRSTIYSSLFSIHFSSTTYLLIHLPTTYIPIIHHLSNPLFNIQQPDPRGYSINQFVAIISTRYPSPAGPAFPSLPFPSLPFPSLLT